MQQVLLTLTEFWAGHGCTVLPAAGGEVGAGTLSPATFLRFLGPEPWRAACAEPSVRPGEARYGDNPHRFATDPRFQVVLKPEPGNARELYLASLRRLGIEEDRHDIRFTEADWSSPPLGVWGLGWEVRLDGLEITRLTYFQQAAGQILDPVPVEISYSLERIVMASQRLAAVGGVQSGPSGVQSGPGGVQSGPSGVQYSPALSYQEVFGQADAEMSAYFLDAADLATHRSLFELYEAEARRLLQRGLPLPAYSCVLRCAHLFSILDARRAVGVTERTRAFARLRELSHQVATLWLRHRQERGHPLGSTPVSKLPVSKLPVSDRPVPQPPGGGQPGVKYPRTDRPEPFVFEIGFEDLPAVEVPRTADAVRAALTERLAATRLRHGELRVLASSRRVVAIVDEVHPGEEDHELTVRGPRFAAAFTGDGKPSQAALGFARAHGVELSELRRLDLDSGRYVGFVRTQRGRPAAEVLAQILPEVVTGLRAGSNMRWNAPGLRFARPIRWVLAILGRHVVPFTVSILRSGRTTRLSRAADTPVLEVASAGGYLELLDSHGVTADGQERVRKLVDASEGAARTVAGSVAGTAAERRLVAEAADLVERPVPLLGQFGSAYLTLPGEVLTTVMRAHQRCLPVRTNEGRLLPYFVAVADGDCDREAVTGAHEEVLDARYSDLSSRYERDLETPPEQMRKGLGEIAFTDRLGSVVDRADRVAAVALELSTHLDLDTAERATLARAGELAKFDLGSELVTELPGLAGVMAREYATRAGETEAVAEALYEMELPRRAGGEAPATVAGALLALADRLDLLAGLFAVGARPTGSSDSFGLRRAAAGLIAILSSQPRLAPVTLEGALDVAARHQLVEVDEKARGEVQGFLARRFERRLLDAGYPPRVVRAVLPVSSSLTGAESRAAELARMISVPDFQVLLAALRRVRRILPADAPAGHYPQIFSSPAEANLHAALVRALADLGEGPPTLGQFAVVAQGLVQPIGTFFTEVRVMTQDPIVRANRLGLLAAVRDLGRRVLVWEELER